MQHPNFFGCLEEVEATRRGRARKRGAVHRQLRSDQPRPAETARATTAPTSPSPKGSAWAIRWRYGGPYLGILACREEFVRKMPGRLVGQTVDRNGKRCWVLTLQTREQHIRREKATSNICTNQGLFALRAAVYLAALGPQGLKETAELCLRKAHYAAEQLTQIAGRVAALRPAVLQGVHAPSCRATCRRLLDASCLQAGYHARPAAGPLVSEHWTNCVSVAVTEKRTQTEIDGLAAAHRQCR